VAISFPRITQRNLALVVLGAAMMAAAVFLAYEERGQTLKGDEWDYAIRLSSQPLGHALFNPPHDKYLMPVPLLLYKGLFEIFGIGSYTPYRVVSIALVILSAGLFFALARRRVGDLLALPPAILLLFFGSAPKALPYGLEQAGIVVSPLRIPSQIAIATGLGMLLALERRTLRGDVLACVLLAASLLSHPESLAFAAAAAVLILFRPSPERWRRSWVFVAPLAVFAVLSGRPGGGGTNPALDRLSGAPSFIADSFATVSADISGVSGLINGSAYDSALGWIAAGLVLALLILVVARRSEPLKPGVWAMLIALIVLLVSTAFAPPSLGRTPETPRYIYPEAILLLLLLAEVASVVRIPRTAQFLVVALAAAALLANVGDLRRGAATMRDISTKVKAELGAVDLARKARGHIDPDFLPLGPQVSYALSTRPTDVGLFWPKPQTLPGVGGIGWQMRASEYFRIKRDFGSPAYSPEEVAESLPAARRLADVVLVGALRLRFQHASRRPPSSQRTGPRVKLEPQGGARKRGSCLQVSPQGSPDRGVAAAIALPPGGAWLGGSPSRGTRLFVSRFIEFPVVSLSTPHSAHKLEIPKDGSPVAWELWVKTPRPLDVCALRHA
jgi:hypothetical protein